MSCYYPIPAVRLDSGDISMKAADSARGSPLQLPCGSCSACRVDRVKSWSIRAYHESLLWDSNYFLTLTYDEKHLPPLAQLCPRDLQLFIKRIRRHFRGDKRSPDGRFPVRFLACGEYGEKTSRPHYHILLFNVRLNDLKPYDSTQFTSPRLSSLWAKGLVTVGSLTPASCAYVAGYSLKKIRRSDRQNAPDVVDPRTGECAVHVPQFARMSNRPGIGRYWYDRFATDLHNGYVVHSGVKHAIPRYYRQRLKADYPLVIEDLEIARQQREHHSMLTDPTWDYKNSRVGREAAEAVAKARRSTTKKSKSI